jgi:uncharacterized membrane protein YccC
MVAPATAPPVAVGSRWPTIPPMMASIRPAWSKPAAFRAARATIVVPGIFALTYVVIGNIQMATFAAFGGFATLVLASFNGTRRNKLVDHLTLGAVGTVLLVIGTAVTSTTALAVIVTIPVTFIVLFAGITGPNAASGATAAMLAYVLPAASPGTVSMIPDRIAGWWLATAAGTLAVLILSPRPESDRVRSAAANCAAALADTLDAIHAGADPQESATTALDSKHALMTLFSSTPFRPTGLAHSDQALDHLVETLEWSTSITIDMSREHTDLTGASEVSLELIRLSSAALRDVSSVLPGGESRFDLASIDKLKESSAAEIAELERGQPCAERDVHLSFHARMIASAVLDAVEQAKDAARPADRARSSIRDTLTSAVDRAAGQTSLRSVWFLNSVRGALALAIAVCIADLVHVQHGFWVVLGTLSVLRTNAASTGATALRAIVGTAIGFFIGGALIIGIGTHTAALWAALPIAVLVASYAPGTAPFAVGQAAFTVTISVLYNILVPVGWKLGVVRIEDVAIGAGVSAAVGLLFWPRGVSAILASDLAESFRLGGQYLLQSTAWAVGSRTVPPDAGPRTATAAQRLDDAIRGFVSEQGTKRIAKEHLWRMVGSTLCLRLTSRSLADVPRPDAPGDAGRHGVVGEAEWLAERCGHIAARLSKPSDNGAPDPAADLTSEFSPLQPDTGYLLWVHEHIEHMRRRLADLVEPVEAVSAARSLPWWR